MARATNERTSTLEAMRAMLASLAPVYCCDVESVARALRVTPRHVQRLCADGTLPQPKRPGCYDMPAMVRTWALHQAGVPIPLSFKTAVFQFVQAKDVLEECLRRYPSQRPSHYTNAESCLWPVKPLEPILARPQSVDVTRLDTHAACAVMGLSWFAFDALGVPRIDDKRG